MSSNPLADMSAFDVVEALERRFPIDGPFDRPFDVAAVAYAISELVRYLNHATLPGRAEEALPAPAATHQATSNLRSAVGGMAQLLEQLAERQREHAQDPRLYADALGTAPAGGPASLAAVAAAGLAGAARMLDAADGALRQAVMASGRLGYRDVEQDQGGSETLNRAQLEAALDARRTTK